MNLVIYFSINFFSIFCSLRLLPHTLLHKLNFIFSYLYYTERFKFEAYVASAHSFNTCVFPLSFKRRKTHKMKRWRKATKHSLNEHFSVEIDLFIKFLFRTVVAAQLKNEIYINKCESHGMLIDLFAPLNSIVYGFCCLCCRATSV